MNPDHLKILQQGVKAWNAWRDQEPTVRPDLSEADLNKADLRGANLTGANLYRVSFILANLFEADLRGANLDFTNLHSAGLRNANLSGICIERGLLNYVDLSGANLNGAILSRQDLSGARCIETDFSGADLSRTNLSRMYLMGANFERANLTEAMIIESSLSSANLNGANLTGAIVNDTSFIKARLRKAELSGADLSGVNLVEADLKGANLTGCRIYGISAWGLKLDEHTKQQNLIITPRNDPEIAVDNIEVAQFVYLMLHTEKIRDAIDTIGKKGVLLLGRFTGGRIAILERLRTELRKRGFLPLVFNFDKPETKDFTETVRLLAGLSRFVIVDITNPRSAPLELQATVPEYMIPFVPILEHGEEPFAMFRDLWIKHRQWVLTPIRYPSVERLIEVLDTKIINPAQVRFAQLLALKAEELPIEDV